MAKDINFYPPDKISILSPRPSSSTRGKYATKASDPMRGIRISDSVWKLLEDCSNMLGMSRSEFIRWVAFAAAHEIFDLAAQSGLKIEHISLDKIIDKNSRPRFEKVLIVESNGTKVSVGERDTHTQSQIGVGQQKARPITEVLDSIINKKKLG